MEITEGKFMTDNNINEKIHVNSSYNKENKKFYVLSNIVLNITGDNPQKLYAYAYLRIDINTHKCTITEMIFDKPISKFKSASEFSEMANRPSHYSIILKRFPSIRYKLKEAAFSKAIIDLTNYITEAI